MMYCVKCKGLTEADNKGTCLRCGYKKIKKPEPNDIMYLTIKDMIYASILEALLEENQIPHIKQPIGYKNPTTSFGSFQFFVPFGAYEKARELLNEFIKD